MDSYFSAWEVIYSFIKLYSTMNPILPVRENTERVHDVHKNIPYTHTCILYSINHHTHTATHLQTYFHALLMNRICCHYPSYIKLYVMTKYARWFHTSRHECYLHPYHTGVYQCISGRIYVSICMWMCIYMCTHIFRIW